jgi:hypothetical protein
MRQKSARFHWRSPILGTLVHVVKEFEARERRLRLRYHSAELTQPHSSLHWQPTGNRAADFDPPSPGWSSIGLSPLQPAARRLPLKPSVDGGGPGPKVGVPLSLSFVFEVFEQKISRNFRILQCEIIPAVVSFQNFGGGILAPALATQPQDPLDGDGVRF